MNHPELYIENQQGVVNIHKLLTPQESASAIFSHVSDGVEIAKKHGLPESIIAIIREHHGTTLLAPFYYKEVEQMGGVEVCQSAFRYQGPKPRSKESAIIMICDSVEAASRSLEEIHEASLSELVHRIVGNRSADRQFVECGLTFKELESIKKALVQRLLAIYHVRVKYPTKVPSEAALDKSEASDRTPQESPSFVQ